MAADEKFAAKFEAARKVPREIGAYIRKSRTNVDGSTRVMNDSGDRVNVKYVAVYTFVVA
jgi:hypothetical protein